jgi:hypothetical protein
MFDYNQELERRTEQFAGWIRKMHERLAGGHDPCFLIFDEELPDAGHERKAARVRARSLTLTSSGTSCSGEGNIDLGTDDQDNDDGADSKERIAKFIQIGFDKPSFFMDLPITILSKSEADTLRRDRTGFCYKHECPKFTPDMDAIQACPFIKTYVSGDYSTAAMDTAYIFFQLWKFPVDWTFYVTAFSRKANFEGGLPMK